MTDGWIPDEEWAHIQRIVPIVCVDVLPIRREPTGQITKVGLILRYTPDGSSRWCLVGGRVRFGEPIPAAVMRHMRDSLGTEVQFDISQWREPLYVAQYCPAPQEGFLSDPRKHAISFPMPLSFLAKWIRATKRLTFTGSHSISFHNPATLALIKIWS
jgi:ADP-ribose pyrophosphatase YjhB (NUDIX family)